MNEVFQCAYCGKYAPLLRAAITWVEADRRLVEDDNGIEEQVILTLALTDNPYCGQQLAATSMRVGAR